MAVDRRALRKFPGRKRVGRRRRARASAPVSERVCLAVSCKELIDADTLRSSFEYEQAEFLRIFAADRRTRIRAVQAIFKLMGVDRLDPIKKLVWTYIDQPPAWQFLADAGWLDCDAATQAVLNEAERNGVEGVDLPFRDWIYWYSLTAMIQVNLDTRKSRALRRSSPWSTAAPFSRWQYQTRSGWSDCDLDMQRSLGEALHDAERKNTPAVQRLMRGALYEFDFVSLTQTNVATGRVRALRFGPPVVNELSGALQRQRSLGEATTNHGASIRSLLLEPRRK